VRHQTHATGYLEVPTNDLTLRGDVVVVRGWCLFDSSPLSRVEVFINGHHVDDARTFVGRSDVGEAHGHPDAPVAGFEAFVPISSQEFDSTIEVRVVAHSLDGQTWSPRARAVVTRSKEGFRSSEIQKSPKLQLESLSLGDRAHKRVVVFTHSLELGGGQLWLSELIRQMLTFLDNEVVVVSPEDGPLRDVFQSWNVGVHITSSWWDVMSSEKYEGKVLEQSLLMEALGAGAVIVNTLGVFSAVDAASRIGVPVLWCIHESFPLPVYAEIVWPELLSPQVRAQFEECFQAADGLIFEARQTADLFSALSTGANEFLLDYGIDLAEIDRYRRVRDRRQTRTSRGFGDDEVIVVVLGVFEPRKAQGAAARAFEEIAQVHESVHLVLVGATGADYSSCVEEQVSRLRHSDRIHVIPVGPDYYEWLLMADVFLSASDIESLPRSILEAMAFELPIVSTDVFGVGSLIEDRQTGWLTAPRDLARLIGVLEVVLDLSNEERLAVASAARASLEHRHSGPQYGERVAGALGDLLLDSNSNLARWFDQVSPSKGREETMNEPLTGTGSGSDRAKISQLEVLCDRLRRESEQTALLLLEEKQAMQRLLQREDRVLISSTGSSKSTEVVAVLQDEIAALMATRSWRWTAPLRRIRGLFNKRA